MLPRQLFRAVDALKVAYQARANYFRPFANASYFAPVISRRTLFCLAISFFGGRLPAGHSLTNFSGSPDLSTTSLLKSFSIPVSSFFIALQTLSVAIFVFHLIIDLVFGIYVYTAFQVRSSSLQRNNFTYVDDSSAGDENVEYLKQAV